MELLRSCCYLMPFEPSLGLSLIFYMSCGSQLYQAMGVGCMRLGRLVVFRDVAWCDLGD